MDKKKILAEFKEISNFSTKDLIYIEFEKALNYFVSKLTVESFSYNITQQDSIIIYTEKTGYKIYYEIFYDNTIVVNIYENSTKNQVLSINDDIFKSIEDFFLIQILSELYLKLELEVENLNITRLCFKLEESLLNNKSTLLNFLKKLFVRMNSLNLPYYSNVDYTFIGNEEDVNNFCKDIDPIYTKILSKRFNNNFDRLQFIKNWILELES